MEITSLIVVLSLVTMLALIIFALASKVKTERRLNDPNAEKSTLASDKSSTGKPIDV
jgi:hypothetical protein